MNSQNSYYTLIKAWILNLLIGLARRVLIFSSSPVIRVIVILLMISTLCIFMYKEGNLSLFSYVTFLIFLGGLIVLFTYICSIASNEKYNKTKISWRVDAFIIVWGLVLWGLGVNYPQPFSERAIKSSIKLFFFCSETLYLYIFFYLIATLFVCVYLTKKKRGSSTSKSYLWSYEKHILYSKL